MTRTARNEYRPDYVSPPGETLEELLEEIGLSQAELARRTGRPKKTINEIIKGKAAISQETALQLELVLGVPAEFWSQRENDYRVSRARSTERQQFEEWTDWLKNFPVAAMARLGFIEKRTKKHEKVRELLSFFSVASPDEWRQVYEPREVSFRKSEKFDADFGALSAWLRQGSRQAARIDCAEYDEPTFLGTLHDVRRLTRSPIQEGTDQLVKRCSESGVAVVFVPELPGSRASGATCWLSPTKALVQLSLRYKTDDQFWFTFFHEAAHILLHGKRKIFIENQGSSGAEEAEADRFAADILIPREDFERLRKNFRGTLGEIDNFSRKIGIAPGIVVGRLQHDRLLPFTHLNRLKRRLQWKS